MEFFKKIKGMFKKSYYTEVINLDTLGGDWDTAELGFRILEKERKEKKRLPANPIDIVHEVENGVSFPIIRCKEKIKELERRIKFVEETMEEEPTDELRAIEILKARIKYPKYSHLFRWKTTTQPHIQKLLDEYELEHRGIRYYMRGIPPQAITSMELYAKVYKKVSNNTKPKFSLIAPPEYFKNPNNDPILLAESPFGQFFYILGAWDKEISLVSKLLDGEELIIDRNGNGNIKKV